MVTRRDLLKLGASGLAVGAVSRVALSAAQTPKRGGTLTVRAWDPPHFDHVITHSYKTHVPISFTQNYGPNLGFDLGGRMLAAWLER
jgi:hypothetical protein